MALFQSAIIFLSALGLCRASVLPRATCCSLLSSQFPQQVSEFGTSEYTAFDQEFWSSAAVLTPNCIFAPTHASQVAAAVKIFADHGCEFAVRGGGHSAVPGAANIDDGILITYENMKNISMHLDSNPQYVSIEPGLVWGEVYEYVEKFNKVPLCGRFFPVGTGLALGAGFSFLFNEYGFAVDNVHTYEMVLANGSLVEVNRHNFPDLFHAQKGGGNNFGVVTRYDLLLKEGGLVVGGEVVAPENQTEQWLDLVYDYSTRQAVQDVKTHALPAIAWVGQGDLVVSETPVYYNDHNSSTLPPIMSGWVKDIQLIGNTVRQTNYSSLATEYATGFGDGLFQEQRTYTIYANRAEYAYAWYTFLAWARSIGNVDGFNLLHCNMPMTPHSMNAGVQLGGNSLGLAGTDKVLTVLYFGITLNTRNDTIVNSFRDLFTSLEKHSESAGLLHPYIMWNYAGTGQKVLESYGDQSNDLMKAVRAKYDHAGVFDKLVPGGFKL